jgi:hypothetical protein
VTTPAAPVGTQNLLTLTNLSAPVYFRLRGP